MSAAAAWIQGLDQGGARETFIQGVFDSREFRNRRISTAYRSYLHRPASDSELSAWYVFVIRTGATPSKFLAEFLNSAEFVGAA
jgi:hypothetical protein